MIRRFNYTGRKRIARGHVDVLLSRAEGRAPEAEISVELASYSLPAGARVYVDAYRVTSFLRFDHGTVGEPRAREPLSLVGFGDGGGVRFRVRVVEDPGSLLTGPPRILAQVEGVRPRFAAGDEKGQSLLPVDWGEFEGELWRLRIDADSGPLLLVSRREVPDRDAFVSSREFGSLVGPKVLREILERALEERGADEDAPSWAADWLRFAAQLSPKSPPPPSTGLGGRTDDDEDWLDEIVTAFARRVDLRARFLGWWEPS